MSSETQPTPSNGAPIQSIEPSTGSVTPVLGYKVQTDAAIALVNEQKLSEEVILRHLDKLKKDKGIDQRWLNISRTHFELAFMALNRSIMRPGRVPLPEDSAFNAAPTAH